MVKNIKLVCNCKLAEQLRTLVPLPGSDYQKIMFVKMKAGDEIKPHVHPEHLLLYYPMDASPISWDPVPGVVIYMPPGTRHWVSPVDADRVSMAMVVEDLIGATYDG